jgi:anthranilate phosphoribosyltransferase
MIQEGIQKLIEGTNLTFEESAQIMTEILSGRVTNSQTAAFLTALRMKGEVVEELIAFASVMRKNCHQIQPNVCGRLIDTCGTGGDRVKTFNVSTASAFVIAGAGVAVAKHGNRGVTSKSGSADVLEKLGINLSMDPKEIEGIIEKVGIGFMFAPTFHPAMKYAAEPRREIGIRTVFNILGPLTNPACANAQLLGVYDKKLTSSMAFALGKLGCEEAMVVHGLDGLDEVSTVGQTIISHLKQGNVVNTVYSPRDFGLKKALVTELQTSTAEESCEVLFRILKGNLKENAKVDIVLVNSAAGLIVGGRVKDFKEGIEMARKSIESGMSYVKLKDLVKASGGSLQRLEELDAKYE